MVIRKNPFHRMGISWFDKSFESIYIVFLVWNEMRPTPHPSHGSEIITSWTANKPNCNLRATKDQATLRGWDQFQQMLNKYQTNINQISNIYWTSAEQIWRRKKQRIRLRSKAGINCIGAEIKYQTNIKQMLNKYQRNINQIWNEYWTNAEQIWANKTNKG